MEALHPGGDTGGIPQGAHQHIGKAGAEQVQADADDDLLAVAVDGQHAQDQGQKRAAGTAAQQTHPGTAGIVGAYGGQKAAEDHGALDADVDDAGPLTDGAGQGAKGDGGGQPDGGGEKVGK